MKIAFVTDDGKTITQHFGRAGKYLVIETEDGKVLSRDLRDKFGHTYFHKAGEDHNHDHAQDHSSPENHQKHIQMVDVIADCDIVICGGMGRGAFASITSLGKEVFMTNAIDIELALDGYLKGELVNMSDLIH